MVKIDFDKDYYATLGVPPSASNEEIRRAYRLLAKEAHPDRNNNSSESKERFIKLTAAHDILTDDQLRAEYDNVRFGARTGPAPVPYTPGSDHDSGIEVIEPPDLDPAEVSFVVSRGDRAIKQMRVKIRNRERYSDMAFAFEPDQGEFWIAHRSEVSPGSFTISTALSPDRWKPTPYTDQLWVYWAEAPDRRSKLAISVTTGHSPGGGSPAVPPTRQPVPASYVGRSAGSTVRSILGLLVVVAVLAALGYGGYLLYQKVNAPGNDPNARGNAVCNNVFTENDFAELVEPVIRRGNYPYELKPPIPGAQAVCYHNFDVSDATLQNRVVVSVLCGEEANAGLQAFMSTSGLAPFDAVQGAYIATTAENNSASEDTAIFKTASGEVVSVKVNFLYEGKAYGNLPFSYRKEIVAAVLPVAAEREAEKHIC